MPFETFGGSSSASPMVSINRAGSASVGFAWSAPKRVPPRAVSVGSPSLLASHPKKADASKMHELLPSNAFYMATSRVSEHSVEFKPKLDSATSAHVRKHRAGTIPGRPDYEPIARFKHNVAHGGFAHVRTLDDILAEKEAARKSKESAYYPATRAPKTSLAKQREEQAREKERRAKEMREAKMSAKAYREQQEQDARLQMRRMQLAFAEADTNGDEELDFGEFCVMLPKQTTLLHSQEEISRWFSLADTNGNGTISMDEFFMWSLTVAANKTGAGILSVFRRYDKDGSGKLDELEFTRAAEDMGYGAFAQNIFSSLPKNSDNTVTLTKILDDLMATGPRNSHTRDFMLAMTWDVQRKLDIVIDDSVHRFDGDTADEICDSLLALLERNQLRLSDLFRELDDDGSYLVNFTEFKRAFEEELRFSGNGAALVQVFDILDPDNSGRIGFSDLQTWASKKESAIRHSLRRAGSISFARAARGNYEQEEPWSEHRLRQELVDEMALKDVRIIDLMRLWDTSGDGTLEKHEFTSQMKRVAGPNHVDFYDAMVRDAAVSAFKTMSNLERRPAHADDSTISFVELTKWLFPPQTAKAVRHRRSLQSLRKWFRFRFNVPFYIPAQVPAKCLELFQVTGSEEEEEEDSNPEESDTILADDDEAALEEAREEELAAARAKDEAAREEREAAARKLSHDEQKAAEAILHMRKQQLAFAEADANGDQVLELSELITMLPPRTTKYHSEKALKRWCKIADLEGAGAISLRSFFLWSLSVASKKTGTGLKGIFAKYDQDGSNKLDEMEFAQAVGDMGYGDYAHDIYTSLPLNPDLTVNYLSIDDDVEARIKEVGKAGAADVRDFTGALAWDGAAKRDIAIDDSVHRFEGDTPEEVRLSLLQLLERNDLKLSDVFREMDDDGSNLVAAHEFRSTFQQELKFRGDESILTQIFDDLDGDDSGRVGFGELQAWMRGKKTKAALKIEAMASISLADRIVEEEEAWDEQRLLKELQALFASQGLLPTDVVRVWAGEDNSISKREFLKNMKALVNDEKLWYSELRGAVTDAFETIDSTDDGSISIVELCRWLEGETAAAGSTRRSHR